MLVNHEQVLAFLPHRDPFLFIDTVDRIELPASLAGKKGPFTFAELIGAKVVCNFNVRPTVKVLEGHFPGYPILPGVVQVEMMAQGAAFIVVHAVDKPIHEAKLDVALLAVEKARFRKPVLPGMELEIHSVLTRVRGPIQSYDCQIFSAGELVSESSVMASIKIT